MYSMVVKRGYYINYNYFCNVRVREKNSHELEQSNDAF